MRSQKVFEGSIGFEIRGSSSPRFRRKGQYENTDDLSLQIPNGDLQLGKTYYVTNCSSCHHLDIETLLGPALRTVYLRRFRKNWAAEYGSGDLQAIKRFIWTRKRLWEFLRNPEKMFVDTAMTFDAIVDPFTLASVIDYLQYLRVFTSDQKKEVI